MPKEKKTPERMCVVCREMKPKKLLLRVVKTPDGEILYDPTGKASGRGAYICASRECFSRLPKVRGFERAFKCRISPEVFDAVETVVNNESGADKID